MKLEQGSELKIAVIGGGWYGCHTAAEIKKHFPNTDVTLFEKNSEIFSAVSGNFGIRLHSGPHYPRSLQTRIKCHDGFQEFLECYPELSNDDLFTDYAHGILDANNQPSKISKEKFASVCQEFGNAIKLDWTKERNYTGMNYLANIHERRLVLGSRLREFFSKRLTELFVKLRLNFEILEVTKSQSGITIRGNGEFYNFDRVINATCFQSLLPPTLQNLIGGIAVKYNTVAALVYECTTSPLPKEPYSLIVLDGSFPCFDPYDDRSNTDHPLKKYILTHVTHTNLGEYDNLEDAQKLLSNIDDEFIQSQVRIPAETEMRRFWPAFSDNFKYLECIGTVIPKIVSSSAFRTAITFQAKSTGMVYIFPGKINNIFDAAKDAMTLIGLEGNRKIIEQNEFSYVDGGILHSAIREIGNRRDIA